MKYARQLFNKRSFRTNEIEYEQEQAYNCQGYSHISQKQAPLTDTASSLNSYPHSVDDHPTNAVFRVLRAGPRTSLQDAGRRGMKWIGMPPGGAMDLGILERLNRLFDQHPHTAALEMLWAGLQLECLSDVWIAYGGAAKAFLERDPIDAERTIFVRYGKTLRFQADDSGLWSYLVLAGGWYGKSWYRSLSVWPEKGIGKSLEDHDLLFAASSDRWNPPRGIAARFSKPQDPPENCSIRVYPGPQWREFSESSKHHFFEISWEISMQISRAGYRLKGGKIETPSRQLISEPTLVGSIQIPPDGQPIVLLNDGPTIGGYHKIAMIHRDDLDRFRQMPPGQHVNFSLIS